MNQSFETIENLRKIAGTLPSERPKKMTNIKYINESLEIELIDHNKNPYKAMFLTATATWGDNEYINKWPITTDEGKFEVIKAVLTHNTLPQAREVVNFIFRVKGVPRYLFDKHTQVKFMTIMSIGCRDNNKLDSDIIVTDKTYKNIFLDLKDLYETVLNNEGSSWQSARTFLPQSYSHGYFFSQNLLAISNALIGNNDLDIENLYKKNITQEIYNNFPLLGEYLLNVYDNKTQILFNEKLINTKFEDLNIKDKEYFRSI